MPAWDYDQIIIGGGPAGLTAGIYAGRARLCAVMLEKLMHGGQMMTTDLVENYPGFPEGISGFELSERLLRQQAERFELLMENGEVSEIIPGQHGAHRSHGRPAATTPSPPLWVTAPLPPARWKDILKN
jgi:thioredoxin reductase